MQQEISVLLGSKWQESIVIVDKEIFSEGCLDTAPSSLTTVTFPAQWTIHEIHYHQ